MPDSPNSTIQLLNITVFSILIKAAKSELIIIIIIVIIISLSKYFEKIIKSIPAQSTILLPLNNSIIG